MFAIFRPGSKQRMLEFIGKGEDVRSVLIVSCGYESMAVSVAEGMEGIDAGG